MKPKFKVGQVVIWTSGKKTWPVLILEVIEDEGLFYYRYNRKNALHQSMLRALTPVECGIDGFEANRKGGAA